MIDKRLIEMAIRCCKNIRNVNTNHIKASMDIAIEALEKADKYHWHDLRKNPEELPDAVHRGYVQVEIITKYYKIPQYCEYGFVDGFGYYFLGLPQEDIIAWRYLELFEEEEET